MRNPQVIAYSAFLVASLWSTAPLTAQGDGPVPLRLLEPQRTRAFTEAAALHAAALTRLPPSASAGLWIVQDAQGRLVSSGILTPFPKSIGSETYGTVVPGASGRAAIAYGFARTLQSPTRPAFRVAYVTLASAD